MVSNMVSMVSNMVSMVSKITFVSFKLFMYAEFTNNWYTAEAYAEPC